MYHANSVGLAAPQVGVLKRIEGEALFARALCHEIGHLDGHLYLERVEGSLLNVEDLSED